MSRIKQNNDEEIQVEKISVDKRANSMKFFSVGSVFVIIAILLVVNILFDSVLGNTLKWDFSSMQTNSLSSVSKGIISKLDKDVEIVGLFARTSDTESTYKDFIPLLDEYAKYSGGHITVRYVDPNVYPSISTELDPNKTITITANTFVVKCGDKLRVINPADCYTYDEQAYYYSGQTVIQSVSTELKFTGAISSVTSDTVSKVYFTSGHGEATHAQLDTLLNNNGFETADLTTRDLTVIPDDCSLLIVNLPTSDISTDDIPLISNYLQTGGNLIVISDYSSATDQAFTNLNEVLHTMNLNLTNSRICENDMNYRIQATTGYGSYAIVPAGTFSSAEADKAIFAAYGRAVTVYDNPKSYITTEPLITTSANAVLEDKGDPSTIGTAGTQNFAMYSKNSGGKTDSEAVVIGTSYLTSDAYISAYSLNDQNVVFFSTVVKQLVGIDNTVQVPVKEYPNYTFTSTPSASVQGFLSVVLIAILPLAFVITGIVVYKKRKHL